MEGEYPVSFAEVARLGFFSSHGDARCGQSGEVFLFVDYHGERVGGFEQVFVEFEVEARELGVDVGELFLFILGEESAVAHEVLVSFVDESQLVGCEAEFIAVVVDVFDSLPFIITSSSCCEKRGMNSSDMAWSSSEEFDSVSAPNT